jgi:hypothetical protein
MRDCRNRLELDLGKVSTDDPYRGAKDQELVEGIR